MIVFVMIYIAESCYSASFVMAESDLTVVESDKWMVSLFSDLLDDSLYHYHWSDQWSQLCASILAAFQPTMRV